MWVCVCYSELHCICYVPVMLFFLRCTTKTLFALYNHFKAKLDAFISSVITLVRIQFDLHVFFSAALDSIECIWSDFRTRIWPRTLRKYFTRIHRKMTARRRRKTKYKTDCLFVRQLYDVQRCRFVLYRHVWSAVNQLGQASGWTSHMIAFGATNPLDFRAFVPREPHPNRMQCTLSRSCGARW